MRRTVRTLLLIAGTVVPAIAASGNASAVDVVPPLTTTTTTSTSTTTTTAPGGTGTEDVTTTTTAPGATATEEVEEAPAGGAGGLSISVPEVVELSPGTPVGAGGLSAALGAVTVSDQRGGLVAGWTATVTGTDFVAGGGTIPKADVAYWSGPATEMVGAGPFVPGQPTSAEAEALAAAVVAFASLGPSGSSSATWVPTLVVTFPPSAAVGQYVGTITHSVA